MKHITHEITEKIKSHPVTNSPTIPPIIPVNSPTSTATPAITARPVKNRSLVSHVVKGGDNNTKYTNRTITASITGNTMEALECLNDFCLSVSTCTDLQCATGS